jgi:hypothetical protein
MWRDVGLGMQMFFSLPDSVFTEQAGAVGMDVDGKEKSKVSDFVGARIGINTASCSCGVMFGRSRCFGFVTLCSRAARAL